jgi:hypothetical protein
MITISSDLLKAQIESYDGQITIIEGRKSKLQGLLDDPELVEELVGILGKIDTSNPTASPENAVGAKDGYKEEKKDEKVNNGKYSNMQPSDAIFAILSAQSKPGPFGISQIYDFLVKNGLPISGDPQNAFENFTNSIGQDIRLVCDLEAKTVAIRK